jgi:hypothetical protein
MRIAFAAAVTALLVATPVDARTRREHRATTFFLAADPHVPLAVVRARRLEQAVPDAGRGHFCGSKRRWAQVGSKWNALDAWGRVLGTYSVAAKDLYDVTGCAELAFAPKPANDLQTLFVSADSDFHPAPPTRWLPTAPERAALDAIVGAQTPSAVRANYAQCTAISEEPRFFEVPGGGPNRWAVRAGDGGYVIASLTSDTWSVAHTERAPKEQPFAMCHRVLAIFDMDGDARPEIVLRFSEGTWWGDVVLRLDDRGRWQTVAVSPGGSTA